MSAPPNTVPLTILVLPRGSTTAQFVERVTHVDPHSSTPAGILESLRLTGLMVHAAKIVDDDVPMREWYAPNFPVLVAATPDDFVESLEWKAEGNVVARLGNAGVALPAALACVSRARWQVGFDRFINAATVLRQLVEATGDGADYPRRIDVVGVTRPLKELLPVAPVNSHSKGIEWPPRLKGVMGGGAIADEWVEYSRGGISVDEHKRTQQLAQTLREATPHLNAATQCVVRLFMYHAIEGSTQERVVAHTGFFVSPKHILTTRTTLFDPESDTYAKKIRFSTCVRAVHGMLRDGIELLPCEEVAEQVPFLIESVRRIGIVLDDAREPPRFQAVSWTDVMLLEVTDRRHYAGDHQYFLPQMDQEITKNQPLYALSYASRPSAAYIEDVFGAMGHNIDVGMEVLTRQWWDFSTKCVSLGSVFQDPVDHAFMHTCSLLPGGRGAPLVAETHATLRRSRNDPPLCAPLFCGISVGRGWDELRRDREYVTSMSTTDLARNEGLSLALRNDARMCSHPCIALLYLRYIIPAMTNADHVEYLERAMAPHRVLVDANVLRQCHRAMLKDAEDLNECGMLFYEHQDLDGALACFREGARMFSVASIPNLEQRELDLKSALQTNVAAVVVVQKGERGAAFPSRK